MTEPHPAPGSLLEDEALRFIRDLIRIESVNTGDPATIGDGEARAARYVQAALDEAGTDDLLDLDPGAGARRPARGARPGRAARCSCTPTSTSCPSTGRSGRIRRSAPRSRTASLYGRGAVDMKNFAGDILAVARAFRRDGVVPRRDLVFAFFADEEAGGVWGARWLVEHHPELFAGATEALSEVGGFSVPLDAGSPRVPRGDGREGRRVGDAPRSRPARARLRPTADNAVVRLARAVAAVGEHRFPVTRTPALDAFLDEFGAARGVEFTDDALEAQLESSGSSAASSARRARHRIADRARGRIEDERDPRHGDRRASTSGSCPGTRTPSATTCSARGRRHRARGRLVDPADRRPARLAAPRRRPERRSGRRTRTASSCPISCRRAPTTSTWPVSASPDTGSCPFAFPTGSTSSRSSTRPTSTSRSKPVLLGSRHGATSARA